MDKIINSKLTEELKNLIRPHMNYLYCGMSQKSLDSFDSGKTNILLKMSDSKLLAFCIYSNTDEEILLNDLEYDCGHYEDSQYKELEEFISLINDDSIYIHFIESIEKGFGHGIDLLEEIFNLKKDILLYSRPDSSNFWAENDFINIFGNVYIHYS